MTTILILFAERNACIVKQVGIIPSCGSMLRMES